MKNLSLLLGLSVIFALAGCGKKEAPPAPEPQVQAPVAQAQPATPPPAPEPAPATAPELEKKFKSVPGNFTVQVAAWETKESAEKLAEFFNTKGYQARVEDADLDSGRWFRVRIGNYGNSGDARQVADEIMEKYKSNIWLVKL